MATSEDRATTMKISVGTRDRLRRLAAPGETLEDVVVAAVDLKERSDFWARAQLAHRAETRAEADHRRADDLDTDTWLDRLG
jgi:hypothetical protein